MRGSAIARSANALVQANAQHAVYSNGVQAVNLPSNTPAAQVKKLTGKLKINRLNFASLGCHLPESRLGKRNRF